MKKLDHYLENAIKNIEDDREITKEVETLQRSNEQLVKISGLIHKQQSGDTGLSESDRADIFDMLQAEDEGGGVSDG